MAKAHKMTAAEKQIAYGKTVAGQRAAGATAAAASVEEDKKRLMSDAQIQASVASNYANVPGLIGGMQGFIQGNAALSSGILGGFANALPGGQSFDVQNILTDYQNADASNASLGGMFAQSLGADTQASMTRSKAVTTGSRDAEYARLSDQARGFTLDASNAKSDYLARVSELLGIRGQRQNLAATKLQMEQSKRAEARLGSGRGGSPSPTSTLTEAQKKEAARIAQEKADWQKILTSGYRQIPSGLEGLLAPKKG